MSVVIHIFHLVLDLGVSLRVMIHAFACIIEHSSDVTEVIAAHHALDGVQVIHHLVHLLFCLVNSVHELVLWELVVFQFLRRVVFLSLLLAWDANACDESAIIVTWSFTITIDVEDDLADLVWVLRRDSFRLGLEQRTILFPLADFVESNEGVRVGV